MTSLSEIVYGTGKVSDPLVEYFNNTKSLGSYMIADFAVSKMLQKANNGALVFTGSKDYYFNEPNVSLYEQGTGLIQQYLNQYAGEGIYDVSYNQVQSGWVKKTKSSAETIIIGNTSKLTLSEYNMLLLLATGNVDAFAFAAEVQFHANYANSKLVGKSAIKSDHAIGESFFGAVYEPQFEPGGVYYKQQYDMHKSLYQVK